MTIPQNKGQKYPEGLHANVPIEIYHGDCCPEYSVSSSVLRAAKTESLAYAQYHSASLNPNKAKRYAEQEPREDPSESDAKILGSAAHVILLGDEPFHRRFIVAPFKEHFGKNDPMPGVNGIYKAGEKRLWRDQQKAAGITVLTKVQANILKGMKKAVIRDQQEWINAGMFEGENEMSGFWKDKETGLWIKIRPDNIPTNTILGDYKTCRQADDYHLMKSVWDYRYDMQMALAFEGLRHLTGFTLEHCLLLFQETRAPYCARILELDHDYIAAAMVQNRVQMRRIADCIDKYGTDKLWPGPGDGFKKITTPQHIKDEIEAGQRENPDLYPSYHSTGVAISE